MTSKKVFIDSSVLLAFVDRSEVNHFKAVKTMENLARINSQIYTSQQAVSEVYTALSREAGIAVALDFLQACLQSDMEILFPQKADLIAAHRVLRANRDRQLTLREALNAALMQRRDITQIISFNFWQNLFGTSVINIA